MCLFNFLGIRFGWEAVIGIIPFAGDAIGVAMALLVFKKCCTVEGGLTSNIKIQMILNILIDFLVGLVPFIGDLADAAFKCNTKNLRLLEVTLDKKYAPRHQPGGKDERDMRGVNKEQRRKNRRSGLFRHNDPPPATAFEEFSDDEYRDMETGVREPERVRQQPRRRPDDVETGLADDRRGGRR